LKEFVSSFSLFLVVWYLDLLVKKHVQFFSECPHFPPNLAPWNALLRKIDSVFSKKFPLRNLTKNKKFQNKLLAYKENGCKMVEIPENGQ